VAQAFGLTDLNAVAPTNIFDENFNDADGADAGETYGQVLAMISGLDRINSRVTDGGPAPANPQQVTIDELLTALNGGGNDQQPGSPDTVKDLLNQGAINFEFGSSDAETGETGDTNNRANLLTSPALGVSGAPVEDDDGVSPTPAANALLNESLGANPTSTAAATQDRVDTVNAIQDLAALGDGGTIPSGLTEANLTDLGLTGLTAPSPYLAAFLEAVRTAADDGSATDTLAKLQALLDTVVADSLTPSIAQGDGVIEVALPAAATSATLTYTPAGSDRPITLELTNDDGVWTANPADPVGFAIVDGVLTIQNTALANGTNVTFDVSDAAGSEATNSLTGIDTAAPAAPTVAQVDGDVAIGLAADAATATVSYTPEGASAPVDLDLVRNATTGEWETASGDPLPAGFTFVGDNLTIANGTLAEGSDVSVVTADAAGNATDPVALGGDGVDNTAPDITITGPVETDNIVNSIEDNDVVVTGTTTAEDGQVVTVTFTDASSATVTATGTASGGSWTSTAADISALDAGNITITANVTDAAGNPATEAQASVTLENVPPSAPTIDAGITDQANTVSGTGEAGAVVTVLEGSTVIGSATVWTDGTWSFVAPVEDGAVLTATQTDAAGNVSAASSPVTTFTDTDGDGTSNALDTDADGDGILDTNEAGGFTQAPLLSTGGSGTLTTSFSVTVPSVEDQALSQLTFAGQNVRAAGNMFRFPEGVTTSTVGQVYSFTFDQPVNTISLFFDSMILDARFGNFTVTYADTTTQANLDVSVAPDNAFGAPRVAGGGAPFDVAKFVVDGINSIGDGTVGTEDPMIGQNDGQQAAGTVSFSDIDTTKLITALSWEIIALNQNTNDIGTFVTPIVTYRDYTVADTDGTIANSLDIDTDGDRIWDKYEDYDVNEVHRWLLADTDGNGTDDGIEASLDAAAVTAFNTSNANGYAEGFILLSDAGLNLNLTTSGYFGLEYVDMADGTNAQTVTGQAADIALMPGDKLIILGDANDTVDLSAGDTFADTGKDQSIQGSTFSIYEVNVVGTIVQVFIEDEIGTVTI
jgi:hypothetical protein